jgi:hypothetical protein
MISKNNESNKAFSEMLSTSGQVIKDLTEVGIDNFMNEGLAKDIPVLNIAHGVYKFFSGFQYYFFIKKYKAFLQPLQSGNIIEEQKEMFLAKHESDPDFIRNLIEQLIITIDRHQTEQKSIYLGQILISFVKGEITFEEYNYFLYSLDSIHSYVGFERLNDFYVYYNTIKDIEDIQMRRTIWQVNSKIDFSPLSGSGLLNLPTGGMIMGDLGGASLNEMGVKFCKYILEPISVMNNV